MASDRNVGALAEVAARHGWRQVPDDVSKPDQVEALAEAAWREFGQFDLICLNAGAAGPHSRRGRASA